MLKIRLKRVGRKKKACYRIIVIDSRKKRDSKAIEELGFYHPLNKNIKLNLAQAKYRINTGAKATKTVQNLINKTINK